MGNKTFKLENDVFRIEVSPVGAELLSLYSKETDTEYLWQPGYDVWEHHSMLLFPNPGRICGDRTIIGGKIYPATKHGFANDMTFDLVEVDSRHLILQISEDEDTLKSFPYRFRLQVEFSFDGDKVVEKFRVINDDDKPVYFSLGAHPGFYCPIGLDEKGDDYVLEFDRPQNMNALETTPPMLLLTGKKTPYLTDETTVPLNDHYFDHGPRIFDGMKADTITMKSKKTGHFVELGVKDFPYLCLYGVGSRMTILCIEPWCGVSEALDSDHVWERKPGIEKVEVGDVFERTMTFRVG